MTIRSLALTGAALLTLATAVAAQTGGTSTMTPPAKKPGLLSRIFHHGAATPTMRPIPGAYGQPPMHGGMMSHGQMHGGAYGQHPMSGGAYGQHPMTGGMTGGIIGNKNSHVYHMAGDGNLPAPQNRVYFATAAQAEAAGFRAAGSAHGSMGMKHSTMSHSTMSHSTMKH